MATNLDLTDYKALAEAALSMHSRASGRRLEFGQVPEFTLTPDKPNSARAVVPAFSQGKPVGDAYVIVFMPGDGTGDENSYKLSDIHVPRHLTYEQKPERVVPRDKTGVIAEAFLPLFSINPDGFGEICWFANCLEELTLGETANGTEIVHAWNLGLEPSVYHEAIRRRMSSTPRAFCTVGNTSEGKRFGDPHSIHYSRNIGPLAQVGAFLGTKDPESPLVELAQTWEKPLGYR